MLLIGIFAALFLARGDPDPTYDDRAITNIEQIVTAMKVYYIKYESHDALDGLNTLAAINQTLGLELTDTNFDYQISGFQGPGISGLYIDAERNSGDRDGQIIRYELNLVGGDPDRWTPDDFPNRWYQHP